MTNSMNIQRQSFLVKDTFVTKEPYADGLQMARRVFIRKFIKFFIAIKKSKGLNFYFLYTDTGPWTSGEICSYSGDPSHSESYCTPRKVESHKTSQGDISSSSQDYCSSHQLRLYDKAS